MKTKIIFVLGLFIGLLSCHNGKTQKKDEREEILGNYKGTRISTYWIDSIVDYGRDTTNITIALTMSEQDSIINITFDPPYSNANYSFKYADSIFTSTSNYHPPMLLLSSDSLYFMHQPGFAPFWTECFTKKE